MLPCLLLLCFGNLLGLYLLLLVLLTSLLCLLMLIVCFLCLLFGCLQLLFDFAGVGCLFRFALLCVASCWLCVVFIS